MKNEIFYKVFALLCSTRTEGFIKELRTYQTFLKEKVLPYQKGETRKLKANTPPKIKEGYKRFKNKIKECYSDFQIEFENLGITKEKLRTFDNCRTFIGMGLKTKMILNFLKNFEKPEFNETLDQRISEIEGLVTHLDEVKSNLDKKLFPMKKK